MVALLGNPSESFAKEREIYVFLDGDQMEFTNSPFVKNGTTLIEFRPIFEALGLTVKWDAKRKKVTGTKKGLKIEMTLNNRTALVNGNRIQMPVAPTTKNGRTLVPLRFVSEASGKKVAWNGDVQMIIINDGKFERFNRNAPPLSYQTLEDSYYGKIGGLKYNLYSGTTVAEFVNRFGFPDYRHDGTMYSDDMPFIMYGDYLFYTDNYSSKYSPVFLNGRTEIQLPYYTTVRDVVNQLGYPDEIDYGLSANLYYYFGKYTLIFEVEDFYYNSDAYNYELVLSW